MARKLLSFAPDDQDQRLQSYLYGGNTPLSDPQQTPDAPPAPDYVPQQDPGADTATAQPAADPQQPDNTPTPAPTPQQPTAAATPQQPPMSMQDQLLQQLLAQRQSEDPALAARWKQEEIGALDRADALRNQKYGGWEGLRDALPAIAPTILDIGFNKGRGLSGIVSATAQGAAQHEADHRAEMQAADEYALKLHQQRGAHQPDPLTQMLAIGRLGVSQQNANTTGKRVQGTEDWRSQQANPESALSTTQVTQAGRKAGAAATASTTARQDVEHGNNERTAGDRAAIRAAETGAQIQTQLGYSPQLAGAAGMKSGAEAAASAQAQHDAAPVANEDAAARAAAIARAQITPHLEQEQGMNSILADRSNNGVGAGLSAEGIARANPGLEVSDSSLLQQAMKTRQINQKTLDDIKAANRGSEIVERLHDTAATYQSLIKNDPTAITSPQAAELRRQYKAHAEEYAGVIGRVSGNASITSHKEALDLVPDIHNPYATDGIRGLWSPLEANINGNLGAIGIKARAPAFMGGRQPRQQQAQPAVSPPPPSDNLGNTSGPVPKVNTVLGLPPPPNDLVTVSLDGQRAQVPRAQAQAMKQLNPALEIQ